MRLRASTWRNSDRIELIRSPGHQTHKRSFLVYLSASPEQQPNWCLDQKRSFDIAVRHHAEPAQNNPLLAAADYVLTGGFSKFHSASQFLKLPQLHKAYSGYLFLDGDVEFEPGAIDRLFAIASLLKLDLAQAADLAQAYGQQLARLWRHRNPLRRPQEALAAAALVDDHLLRQALGDVHLRNVFIS